MKRILFTLAGTLCASLPLAAQNKVTVDPQNPDLTVGMDTTPMVSVTDFFKEPAWAEAFAYTFTPIAEVEPSIDAITVDYIKKTLQPILSAEQPDLALARKSLTDEIGENGADANAVLYYTLGAIDQQLAGSLKPGAENDAAIKAYLDEAIANYKTSIAKFPNYQRAHRNLGMIYMNSSDKAVIIQAIPHLEKAVMLGARDAATYSMLGYCAFVDGRLYAAETAFKNALMLDSKSSDVYQLLAQTLLQQNRYQEARAMFSELIAKDPSNDKWWMALVNTYLAENDLDKCVTSLEVLRHMKKADTQSMFLLGNIYVMRNMLDQASDVYVEAINMADPKTSSPDDAIDAAKSLAGYSALDQANKIITLVQSKYKSKLTDEDSMNLLTLKSNIQIAQGNGAEAAKTLAEILTRDPLNGAALNALASYYSEQVDLGKDSDGKTQMGPRDFEQAVLLLGRAEKLNDSKAAAAAMRQHARLLINKGDTDSLSDAVELLESSQSLDPQSNMNDYISNIREVIAARTAR